MDREFLLVIVPLPVQLYSSRFNNSFEYIVFLPKSGFVSIHDLIIVFCPKDRGHVGFSFEHPILAPVCLSM